eukprot:1141280-Pelagomonas_calceolata.AAC.6
MMIEVKRALKDETRSACVPSRVHTCRSQSPRQSMPGPCQPAKETRRGEKMKAHACNDVGGHQRNNARQAKTLGLDG